MSKFKRNDEDIDDIDTSETAQQNIIVTHDINAEQHFNDVQNENDKDLHSEFNEFLMECFNDPIVPPLPIKRIKNPNKKQIRKTPQIDKRDRRGRIQLRGPRKKRNTNQTTSVTAQQNHIVTDDIIAEQYSNDVQYEYDEIHSFEINDSFMAFDHNEYEENLSSEINDVFMAFDHMDQTINNNTTTHQHINNKTLLIIK